MTKGVLQLTASETVCLGSSRTLSQPHAVGNDCGHHRLLGDGAGPQQP